MTNCAPLPKAAKLIKAKQLTTLLNVGRYIPHSLVQAPIGANVLSGSCMCLNKRSRRRWHFDAPTEDGFCAYKKLPRRRLTKIALELTFSPVKHKLLDVADNISQI